MPSSTSTGTRQVIAIATSARDRHRAERGRQHLVDVDALELGLGPQRQPVRQRRLRQRLHVVGGHEVAAGAATPTPAPMRSSAVAPRGLTPRLSDGDVRVARAMSTMYAATSSETRTVPTAAATPAATCAGVGHRA